ncbi:MAG: NAD-dependent epimerase/dehydratase family protein, partial [Ferruginibacter sp.]
METVLITGGTGLIGKQLSRYLLKKSYNVTILTRSTPAEKDSDGIHYAAWDVEKEQINIAAITNADYIIHLAGAPVVAKRWTKAYKNEIINSRTKSSGLIIKTLQQNKNKVKGIVSASAIGW